MLVADVADIVGGTPKLRRLIGRLDLDELKDLKSVTITRRQIVARLLVAGFKSNNISVTGGASLQVRFVKQQDFRRVIEGKLAAEIARQFGIDEADVQINLSGKTDLAAISNAIDVHNFRVMTILPNRLPLGEKTIQTEFSDTNGKRFSTQLSMRIVVLKDVVVTSHPVPRGTVITAEHIQSVKRPLSSGNIELASLDCIGCTAAQDIPPHEIVSTQFLSKRKPQDRIVINRNDLVDILLVRGPVTIRIRNAKAMTAGAIGETIQVLNTASEKRINAVVKNRSTVLVQN